MPVEANLAPGFVTIHSYFDLKDESVGGLATVSAGLHRSPEREKMTFNTASRCWPLAREAAMNTNETQGLDQGETTSQEGSFLVEPQTIGRYRVLRLLGQGGFGLVYLAHDEQLNRPVAVKVPHARLVSRPEDARAYLDEARTVANLDHPNIVPVYDVGSTDDFPCYVVSKFIDGESLAARIGQGRPTSNEAAELTRLRLRPTRCNRDGSGRA
jgi:hypothetical protein